MLEALRRFVKSWVAKALLALLILSFAVWGIEGVFSGSTNPTIARVGSEQLDAQRLINAVIRQQNQISRQRQQLISLAELREAEVDEAALQAMIRDATFESELKSLQLAVPAEAVRENIRVNPAFLDGQGQFSQFTYQSRLSQEGFDPIEFEDLTRTLLGQQILIGATTNADQYAPGVATQMAKWRGEQRSIRMITLPVDSAADPGQPGEADLQAYFDENSDTFVEPDRRWGRFLHTDIAQLADQLAPTDAEQREAYDADPLVYERQATRTLEQITFEDLSGAQAAADRIASGDATFADIAAEQEVSEVALSLGTVLQDDLPEATASAVFGVTEPGVVGPVEGPFNVVLLNVTALELGGLPEF
ncbi:MAG: peptidylprolyl isomerase, partial [Pseudomonadota bacterium]